MNAAPRILLIDDDEPMLALVMQLIKGEFPNAQVKTVAEANELARALEAGQFNIVVTDYQLGWTNGLAIFHSVKSRYPDCPVIMFTATGSEEIAVEAMKAGLDDYVLKSSKHIGRLTAAVRTVLAQAQQRRQLRESEARQRSLLNDVLDTSAVGLFILDAEFKVVWINSALERYFGVQRADVVGQDKRRLIQERLKYFFDKPDEFATRILQSYERNDYELRFECHMTAADSREERWFEHRSLPIRTGLYAGGRIEHYYDITELQRTGVELRKSEARLAAIIDSAMDAIIMVDSEHRILIFNGAAEMMFRCAATEAVGQSLDRFIPERFRAAHREHIRRFGETGQTNRAMGRLGTVYGLRSDGTEFPLEVSLSKGTVAAKAFYTAILRDITARKQVEEALRESESRLSAMIQASPIAITLLDTEGTVQLWNQAAHRLFQWSESEVLGHPLLTVPPERLEEHRAIRERVERGETIHDMEVVRQRKDGSPVMISLSIVALRDVTGAVQGFLGMMVDMTEQKLREAQGRRSEQLAVLGQLLGGLAHEIKNPLFILTGYLQLFREKLASREYEALLADLPKIEEAAKRMTKITDRFLALSRPYEPRLESCAVNAVLRQALEFLQNELMKNRILVTENIATDLPALRSDPRQLQQAFLNLILNAMQAMVAAHGCGTLTVSAKLSAVSIQPSASEEKPSVISHQPSAPVERWIEVRIQDDGPGIAPEHQSKLFEPFFTTKPAGHGTGLGLWAVKTIVMSLKGTVGIETEVGKGTTVIVSLPVSQKLTIAQN